jgi:hypothetical protein
VSTVPSRVQRHRQADAARRRVRTTGVNLIGKRTTIPKRKPPRSKRPRYRKAGALAGFSGMLAALFFATGQVFWAVGAVTSAGAGVAVAHLEYRRQLAEVKATGKPIGGGAQPTSSPAQPQPAAEPARQPRAKQKPASDHMARCKANPPGGKTCRCPDGPNRKGKPAAKKRRVEAGRRKRG